MPKIIQEAYEIYQKYGQYGVYEYAQSLPFDLPTFYCLPCEDETPWYNGACLVCGSSEEV